MPQVILRILHPGRLIAPVQKAQVVFQPDPMFLQKPHCVKAGKGRTLVVIAPPSDDIAPVHMTPEGIRRPAFSRRDHVQVAEDADLTLSFAPLDQRLPQ